MSTTPPRIPRLGIAGAPPLIPGRRPSRTGGGRLRLIKHTEDLMYGAVALILGGVALCTLLDTGRTLALAVAGSPFASASLGAAATNALCGVLFAASVVEITRTVLKEHFDGKGLQLQSLLSITIVIVVHGVLAVGIELNNMARSNVYTSLLVLGIDVAVVVGLVASLGLVARYSVARYSPLAIGERSGA